MKKLIALILALLLILAMAIPAFAVTPPLDPPDIPTVPDISDDVHVELPESAFEGFIPDIDVEIPAATEAPTEPPAEDDPGTPIWYDWLRGWHEWWSNILH